MIVLRPGDRLYPNRPILSQGLILIYQPDGNLVLYQDLAIDLAVWATMTFDAPGFVEMQHDGNFVMYNAGGSPIWATNTFAAGAVLQMNAQGLQVVVLEPTVLWQTPEIAPLPIPEPPVGQVRQLNGEVLPFNRSYRDATGARYIHGCTDFGGLIKHRENRDKSLRSLDVTAAHQQFIRVAWRLNGGMWTSSGLTIDPIRDTWWEQITRDYLFECNQRNLRINFTCADMYNWTNDNARYWIVRLAQIAASIGPNCVMLHEWNEMRGTVPGGENSVDLLRELTGLWQQHYGTNLRGLSDPGSQDKAGMQKLSQSPANTALIHNTRWGAVDAMRRAYNAPYENYPDKPIDENEPTGPENPNPGGLYGGHVYQPTENHDDLFGIYTTHIMTGQISTYFNDPALYSREPLDSTWGFKELPALWRLMEVPENIGQGELIPGHRSNAPIKLTPGPAEARCDSVVIDGQSFSRLCGGAKTIAGRSGTLTAFRSTGKILEQPINNGQVIPIDASIPTIARIR